MSNGNNVTIIGNCTRDPELRFTPSNQAVTDFGVAVNRRWQNRQTNEWEEAVSFFDVIAWQQLAENVVDTVQKGTRVVVSGRLDQRSWEKDGDKRSKIEIVADEIAPSLKYASAVVTKNEKNEDGDGGGQRGASNGGRSSSSSGRGRSSGGSGRGRDDDLEEEPFRVDAASWWPEVGLGCSPKRMFPST